MNLQVITNQEHKIHTQKYRQKNLNTILKKIIKQQREETREKKEKKQNKKKESEQWNNDNEYIPINNHKVNVLNTSMRRHRKVEWIQEQDSCICCILETHFKFKDTHRLKVKVKNKCSIQMETNRKGSITYITQNRL